MSSYLPSLQTFAKTTAATAAGLATVSLGVLYYGQNYLIYPSAYPPGARVEVPTPQQFGLDYEDLTLENPDGVRIKSFLLRQKKAFPSAAPVYAPEGMSEEDFASSRPTILMFHGNGGNMGHRIPLAQIFYLRMRCNVLMVSYRGYGHSEGSPSEKGLRMDAQTSLDYILKDRSLSKSTIIIYGQSIGGAVSIDVASRNPSSIRALILENTFTSIPRLIPTAMPILSPFSFLCHQKWDSASKVHLIPPNVATLLLSGTSDEIIPSSHMEELEKLFRQTPGSEKREGKLVEFRAGRHNDTCIQPGYWQHVADFIANLD